MYSLLSCFRIACIGSVEKSRSLLQVHAFPFDALISYGVHHVYLPNLRSFCDDMSGPNMRCVGGWPRLEDVASTLSERASRLLRLHSLRARELWLYGLFWHDTADLTWQGSLYKVQSYA